MIQQPVYVRVGTGEAWLGDLEVPDLAPETLETALPRFLCDVGASTGAIALHHDED